MSRGSTRVIHCGALAAHGECDTQQELSVCRRSVSSGFQRQGLLLDKEGEGVPGRGARVHVKARVIDREFREQGELVGRLKRWAACGEP